LVTQPPPNGDHRPFLLGLVGAPIKHSASPAMHEAAAASLGRKALYQLIEIEGADEKKLRELLDGVRDLGFAGVNVTYPYKEAVVPLLDSLSADAETMAAVNTIVVDHGRLSGHNTDVTGFAKAVAPLLTKSTGPIAVIGAGGVGKAAAFAMVKVGATEIRIFDRDFRRTETLGAMLHGLVRVRACRDIAETLDGCRGAVNATPVGMWPNRDSSIPPNLLHSGLWVSDAVYSPLWTPLLLAARDAGAEVMTGRTLAINQAVDAFNLFTGLPAPEAAMAAAFDAAIASRSVATAAA